MQKKLTIVASFGIMLCLGSVYAWSIFVPELIKSYHFSATQAQLIFGTLIAIFPVTMVIVGRKEHLLSPRRRIWLSAFFYSGGYILAYFSQGNFYVILLGIGVMAGVGTGIGYLTSLTTPVQWAPNRKGLVTGIAAAGFGLSAFIVSYIADYLINVNVSILHIFLIMCISYGVVIVVLSFFMFTPQVSSEHDHMHITIKEFLTDKKFVKLFSGIFFGTFAGLLIISNLKPLGATFGLSNSVLVTSVSIFAITNFLGRIFWGYISDKLGASKTIVQALVLQSVAIFLIGWLHQSTFTYLTLSALIGFGFGGNFVLFAKETAHIYGIPNLGKKYPFVFLGYAIAGILGPMTGGVLYDIYNNFSVATFIAAAMSIVGAVLFIVKKSAVISSVKDF